MNTHRLGSSIPVLRMIAEEENIRFYLDFLGYQIDWEHRFREGNPESPLYLQVRNGDSLLHLNGHADENSPTSEVRIPVSNLEGYEQELANRCGNRPKPVAVDPRHQGKKTDMNIYDPSGNLLVFWQSENDS